MRSRGLRRALFCGADVCFAAEYVFSLAAPAPPSSPFDPCRNASRIQLERRARRIPRIPLPRSSGDDGWRRTPPNSCALLIPPSQSLTSFSQPNHLLGYHCESLQLFFRDRTDLFSIRRELIPIATKNRENLAFEHVRRRLSGIRSLLWGTRRATVLEGQVARAGRDWSGSGAEFGSQQVRSTSQFCCSLSS